MEIDLFIPLEELNSSFYNKLLTCSGIVTELSSEFKDDNYGFIQIAFLRSPRKHNQRIGIQQDVCVILQENFVGKMSLGDKIQITGILRVYNANYKKSNYTILAKEIKIINNEAINTLTEQEIEKFETFAKQPLVQQKIANLIFQNVLIDDDIKLIGTLILFCAESPILYEKGIHSNIGFLIIGSSGTYKTTYLKTLGKLRPNYNYQISQISDTKFIGNKSRYKIGGDFCKKAGLADLAKNGIILIDNLEELKNYTLSDLDKNYKKILRKSSIVAAVHSRENQFNDDLSIYKSIQFPRKNTLLRKFDIVLYAPIKPNSQMKSFRDEFLMRIEEENKDFLISNEILIKFMNYAKIKYDPMFKDEKVREQIVQFKNEVLELNEKKNLFRTIDPNNLIRVLFILCKAYARISLRNEITGKDVQNIITIYKKSLVNLEFI